MDHANTIAARSRPPARTGVEPLRIEHPDEPLTIDKTFERPLRPGWYRIEARYGPEGLVGCLVEVLFEDGRSELRRFPVGARNTVACVVRWPKRVVGVRFHLAGSQPRCREGAFLVAPAPVALRFSAVIRWALGAVRRDPKSLGRRTATFMLRLWRRDLAVMPIPPANARDGEPYGTWRALFDEAPERDRQLHEERLAAFPEGPTISVVCLVDAPRGAPAAAAMLASQVYAKWQLVLVTQAREAAHATLQERLSGDTRLLVRHLDDRDIGARFNAGLQAATGDFIVPVDAAVELRPNALLELALAQRRAPGARMIYADEDERSGAGRANPRFKPAWSPEVLSTHDYIGDPFMVEAAAIRQVGGWRPGLGEDACYDLKLRLAAAVGPSAIAHVAKLLVHRTVAPNRDAAPERASSRLIEEHLVRQGTPASVLDDARSPHPRIAYAVPNPAPLVSILMPTKDKATLLRRAVETLLRVTRYEPFELIVMDNGSTQAETLDLFRSWTSEARIRVVASPGAFNFSALNNEGARCARGEILLLLNNDVEIIDPGWLDEMVGLASRPEIGCVGAKLYYPDGTIQHAGVVTGPGGGAGHGHKQAPGGARGYLDRLVTVTNVSAVTGACLAVRADLYRAVGGLDESVFAVAFNDVDFCLKVAAAGYRNVWTPFAEMIHHESVSRGKDLTPEGARRFAREVAALQQRWSVRLLRDPYYSPHLTMDGEGYALRTK